VENTPFNQSVEQFSENLGFTMLIFASFVFIMNIILDGGKLFMLQLIRSLQVVVHLALNKIVFPSIVMMFFTSLVEVAMFDILGEERICSNCNVGTWLEYDEMQIEEKQKYIMNQIQDLGYETNVALNNLGSIGTMLTVYLFKLAILFILVLITLAVKHPRLMRIKNNMMKNAFFGDLFGILLDSYFEILISAYLQLALPE
jgi:hypothetical protein